MILFPYEDVLTKEIESAEEDRKSSWKCLTIVTKIQRQLMQKDGLLLNINQIDATMQHAHYIVSGFVFVNVSVLLASVHYKVCN